MDGPGATELRWDLEAELDRRGWVLAESPARTDILLTVGRLGDQLSAAAELLWSQIPAPRHRALVTAGPVGTQLDAAAGALLTVAAWVREDSMDRPAMLLEAGRTAGNLGPPSARQMGAASHQAHTDHEEHGGGHDDHTGGHEEHTGGHDGHGGEVAGLPMATTSTDRDGLTLDTLTVRLGPVLPGWPTGLVLRAAMQGDVLSDTHLSWTDEPPPDQPADQAVRALDALSRFLVVAGWPAAAREAREARDARRSLPDQPGTLQLVNRLTRKVSRSRALAWSVRGITPGLGDGDVLQRVCRWCDTAQRGAAAQPVTLDELAPALDGLELSAARLAVASVQLTHARVPAGAGSAHD
ncbi:MAG: hypothetical protein ACQERF_10460 [Actinomycetota bacterium]